MILSESFRTLRNPYTFSLYINVRSFLRGLDLRCKYESELGVFRVTSREGTRYASVNSRVLTYANGFNARAKYVGDTYMLQLIPFRKGDLVVDCGASMGDLERYLSLEAPGVEYIGYEANPNDFKCFQKNVGLARARNFGLWNQVGSIPFYVNDSFASSSFIQPPEFTEIVHINASTLSVQFPTQKIRLLKLEAEGAEPEVLEGAVEILGNVDFISADVGPERGVNEEETRDLVVNFLQAAGFDLIQEKMGHRKIVLLKRRGAV
jgi:FkbM family methyltransferase